MPRTVRVTVVVVVSVLAYGTGVHIVQLVAGGLDPYPSMPWWLAVYFVALTVLDPLAAVLLALRRLAGLAMACLVLVTDALANAYANYVVDQSAGITPGRAGQAVITVLAVALLSRVHSMVPWLRRTHDRPM